MTATLLLDDDDDNEFMDSAAGVDVLEMVEWVCDCVAAAAGPCWTRLIIMESFFCLAVWETLLLLEEAQAAATQAT